MIGSVGRGWLLGVTLGAAAAAGLIATALAQVSGGVFNLSWNAIAPGGASANSPYAEQGVIAQPLAGTSSQGQFTLASGFLGGSSGDKYRRILPGISDDGSY